MGIENKDKIPHYLLYVKTCRENKPGGWQFVLKEADGTGKVEVADIEPDVSGERLDLLTIIRALESLDQPSRVTLTTSTQHVRQGVQHGISEWRANDWQWEFFGDMVPIKNADLWRRMDHLLHVHAVECRQFRLDGPHCTLAGPKTKQQPQPINLGFRFAAEVWLKHLARRVTDTLRQGMAMALYNFRRRYVHLGEVTKEIVF